MIERPVSDLVLEASYDRSIDKLLFRLKYAKAWFYYSLESTLVTTPFFLRKLGENLIQKACVEDHRKSFYNLLTKPEQRKKLVVYY
jgi:hypothetical protein